MIGQNNLGRRPEARVAIPSRPGLTESQMRMLIVGTLVTAWLAAQLLLWAQPELFGLAG